MELTITAVFDGNPAQAVGVTRLTLVPGEVFRLPYACRRLRTVQGGAWISAGGRDILLQQGDMAAVASHAKDAALISALGDMPVVLEWEGVDDLCRIQTRFSYWRRWPEKFGSRPRKVGSICA